MVPPLTKENGLGWAGPLLACRRCERSTTGIIESPGAILGLDAVARPSPGLGYAGRPSAKFSDWSI